KDLPNRKDVPVVVHLACHALGKGNDVWLLPADARIDEPSTWLSLHDVLEILSACPARHKLLILDVMRPIADPRLGILTNDVAGKVQAVLAKQPDKHLFVLGACERGQISHEADYIHQSVFGYYLDAGLKGAADGYNPDGKRNDRVSVRELAAFVRKRVDRWTSRNRKARQTPFLMGPEGEDFDLTQKIKESGADPR